MTRHTSRNELWTQLYAKEYRATFGFVCLYAGTWRGTVLYDLTNEKALPSWQTDHVDAGRFKRPRNAMIAVEDEGREIARQSENRVRGMIVWCSQAPASF